MSLSLDFNYSAADCKRLQTLLPAMAMDRIICVNISSSIGLGISIKLKENDSYFNITL